MKLRFTALLLVPLMSISTHTAIHEYQFTGTATEKTGIFSVESSNLVTGSIFLDDVMVEGTGGQTDRSFLALLVVTARNIILKFGCP